jgi:hypothetical protein
MATAKTCRMARRIVLRCRERGYARCSRAASPSGRIQPQGSRRDIAGLL